MRQRSLFALALATLLAGVPAGAAQAAPTADRPSIHGMLLVGHDALFVSHLPMFHAPHDYQAIAEVAFDDAGAALHRRDAEQHPDALYTVEPTADAVLPDLFLVGARYRVNLYRGHFERGGERIADAVPVTVRRIVHFRRFQTDGQAPHDRWIAFGRDGERFLAHRIETAPDFDQVLGLDGGGDGTIDRELAIPSSGALAPGAATPAGPVIRAIYTEFDDLLPPGRR